MECCPQVRNQKGTEMEPLKSVDTTAFKRKPFYKPTLDIQGKMGLMVTVFINMLNWVGK